MQGRGCGLIWRVGWDCRSAVTVLENSTSLSELAIRSPWVSSAVLCMFRSPVLTAPTLGTWNERLPVLIRAIATVSTRS